MVFSKFNEIKNLAQSCGDPSSLLDARKQTYSSGVSIPAEPTEGTSLTVICQIGFEWSDGTQNYLLFCNSTIWTGMKVTCERMLYLKLARGSGS